MMNEERDAPFDSSISLLLTPYGYIASRRDGY